MSERETMSDIAKTAPEGAAAEGAAISMEQAREGAARRLAQLAVGAGLTLEEYVQQASAIEEAGSQLELEEIARELPERSAEGVTRRTRWLVAIFGGTEQRGRWSLSSRLRIVALFGGAKLDLGAAEPEAAESLITVVAALGGAELMAPPGLPVQLSGVSLLGGKSDERSSAPALRGAPLIRVRAFTLLGGVKVSEREPAGGD